MATDLGLGLSMTAQVFIPAWGYDAEDKRASLMSEARDTAPRARPLSGSPY